MIITREDQGKRVDPPYRPYIHGNPWYPVLPRMLLARCVKSQSDFFETTWDEIAWNVVNCHFKIWFSKEVSLHRFALCSFSSSFFGRSFGFREFNKQTTTATAKSTIVVYVHVCVCVTSIIHCSFLCLSLPNSNVKWPRSVHSTEREIGPPIFKISSWKFWRCFMY